MAVKILGAATSGTSDAATKSYVDAHYTAGNGLALASGAFSAVAAANGGLSVGASGIQVAAPTTFTPFSATSFSKGTTGTMNGYLFRCGNMAFVHAEVTFAGTGSNLGSSGLILTLPVAPATYACLNGTYKSALASNYPVVAYNSTISNASCGVAWCRTGVLTGGIDDDSNITNTSPQAAAAGDFLIVSGWYKI